VPVTVLSSQASARDRQGREESSDQADGFWRKWGRRLRESRTLLEALIVAFFIAGSVGACLIMWDRWTDEIGEHQKTMGRAECAEERERNLILERDQLARELKDVRQENADLKQKYSLLAFYSPRSKIVTSYDLRQETGSQLRFGNCPRSPCFLFTLGSIKKDADGVLMARLFIGGEWEGLTAIPQGFAAWLPLKRECYFKLAVPSYDIIFVIEEDRISDLRAGIGISLASSPRIRHGLHVAESGCPKD
jgi:hypothetical protein